jgi:hypothetical protein
MFGSAVAEATRLLEEAVAGLDPALLAQADALAGLDAFSRAEKICAAGRVLCAGRAVQTNAHHGSGARSAAEWLSRRTGQSVGEAIGSLETARALPALPALDEALRAGQVSSPQAAAVAECACADPAAAAGLLDMAASQPLKRLREQARRLAAEGSAEEDKIAAEERLRRERYLRTFTGRDGAVRGEFALAPLEGAKLLAALETEQRRVFDEARRRGERERSAAYAADALVALAERDPAPGQMAATVTVIADAAALRRGATEAGEICEIPGVGPLPVATATGLLGEAWLRLVVRDGVDVASVTHLGRHVPAHVRSALEARDPLCVVPGCGSAQLLEIDHWDTPFAAGGETRLANLCRLCRHHHRLKTHHKHRLVGGPGRWRWLLPGEREEDAPPGEPARGAA